MKASLLILVQLRYNHSGGEGVGHIEMLYCTSLIALVGSGDQPASSPRKFKLWNSKNKVQQVITDSAAQSKRVLFSC